MLLRGAYGLSLRSLIGRHLLQLTASPWTTEASTRERWQFRALTNRKATSCNRAPSTSSLFAFTGHLIPVSIATIVTVDHPSSSLYYYWVALSLYRDKRIAIIRLWWLSQWLVTHGHHPAVTIYSHVASSSDRHTLVRSRFCSGVALVCANPGN